MGEPPWLVARGDGIELVVHARPGARRSAIVGLHGAALAVRLGARPIEGAANRELVRVLAQVLEVPGSAVTLLSGAHGREKRVHVRGLVSDDVLSRLGPYLCVDKGRAGD